MLGNTDETKLNAALAYVLADCPHCGTHYAVTPDPIVPGQWAVYQREPVTPTLSHICTGGLLCLRGHELEVKVKQAVLTRAGEWLDTHVMDAEPILN